MICQPSVKTIAHAVNLLHQGRLVAFPTETVYGLGADASNPQAVQRIFAAKGRPSNHPLIVHIDSSQQLTNWAIDIPDHAWALAKHYWPGPLAIILKKQPHVPLEVTGGQDTVGLRVPNHPVALQLLHEFGGGIAAPSANRFCRISPTQAQHVAEELGNSVDLILDGGDCQVGVESTIIDLSSGAPRLLRHGHISLTDIESLLKIKVAVTCPKQVNNHIRAPGMMDIHYAPQTKALLCPYTDLQTFVNNLIADGKKIGVMYRQTTLTPHQHLLLNKMPDNAENYAHNLYSSLRRLDNQHLDLIIIEQPPADETWNAVNDRLNKATLPYLSLS